MNTPWLLPIALATPRTNFLGPPAVQASSVVGARSREIVGNKLNTAMVHGQPKHQNLSYFTETLGTVVDDG